MPAPHYQQFAYQQYASATPMTPYQQPSPQQYAPSYYPPQDAMPQHAPPQYIYPPPPQTLSPMVQCPSCASRFAPFAIQYDPQFTTWHAGPPASPPNANIAPGPAQHRTMPPPAPAQQSTMPSPLPPQQFAMPPTAPKQQSSIPPPAPAQQRPTIPTQTIDFDVYIGKVRGIYNKYSSSSSSKEYDNSFDATAEIEAIVTKIKTQAKTVSFAGKHYAINAIAEIASEMLEEGGSTLSSEIRKGYYWGSAGDAIEEIIDTLTSEEISILQEDGDLAKELQQLSEIAAEYALDIELGDAIEKITGESESEEDDGA